MTADELRAIEARFNARAEQPFVFLDHVGEDAIALLAEVKRLQEACDAERLRADTFEDLEAHEDGKRREAEAEAKRLRAQLDRAESALESCDMGACPQCGEWVDAAELSPSGDYEPACEACGDSATHQCECGFRTSVPDEFECCPQCGKEPAAFMARVETNDGDN